MTASAKLIHDSVREAYGTAHWVDMTREKVTKAKTQPPNIC
jgi:hypothetical protein